jgi:hypothetical protein
MHMHAFACTRSCDPIALRFADALYRRSVPTSTYAPFDGWAAECRNPTRGCAGPECICPSQSSAAVSARSIGSSSSNASVTPPPLPLKNPYAAAPASTHGLSVSSPSPSPSTIPTQGVHEPGHAGSTLSNSTLTAPLSTTRKQPVPASKIVEAIPAVCGPTADLTCAAELSGCDAFRTSCVAWCDTCDGVQASACNTEDDGSLRAVGSYCAHATCGLAQHGSLLATDYPDGTHVNECTHRGSNHVVMCGNPQLHCALGPSRLRCGDGCFVTA